MENRGNLFKSKEKVIYFSNLKWLLLSLVVVFLDILTKYLVMFYCVLGEMIAVSPFMNCYYVYNFGVAFSLFHEFGIKQCGVLLFIIVLVILILCVMLCFFKDNNRGFFFKIAYAMIIGGSLGNLIDRVRYGGVIDFIDFHICNWHWPTFNIADLSIFIGVLMIFLYDYK